MVEKKKIFLKIDEEYNNYDTNNRYTMFLSHGTSLLQFIVVRRIITIILFLINNNKLIKVITCVSRT